MYRYVYVGMWGRVCGMKMYIAIIGEVVLWPWMLW